MGQASTPAGDVHVPHVAGLETRGRTGVLPYLNVSKLSNRDWVRFVVHRPLLFAPPPVLSLRPR